MVSVLFYVMVFAGSAIMVYNIYGFISFVRYIRVNNAWDGHKLYLALPVVLLIMFLLGYLGFGIFGEPDLLVASILFGGSIFVFIIYRFLNRIIRGVIQKKNLEVELQAVEESNRVKNSFLASISHEMRTPMNVILGVSSIALKNPQLPDETRDQFQKIEMSGEHLLLLINNILDLNYIESGKMSVTNEDFFMKDILKQTDSVGHVLCDAKDLTYRQSAEKEVLRRYLGDEAMIVQILLAILDNAAKYTFAPGTVSLEVFPDQSPQPDTEAVRFVISDTGVGIEESYLPEIYDLFSKEDSSSTNQFGGAGIGLATVKKKLDLLGGKISVESRKNEGTAFTIILPLALSKEQEIRKEDELGEETLEGRRILIAEDMEQNAEIIMDLLEMEGVETEHAGNGRIALEKFSGSQEYYYDAILMDLRMPVMDGLEATRRIRALDRPDAKTVPILSLTANAFETDVQQSLEAGMNEHLAKPVDAEKMYTALKYHISRSKKEQT